MKYARAPNGETVSFPDDVSDAEIAHYFSTAPQYQPIQVAPPQAMQQPAAPGAPSNPWNIGQDINALYRGGVQGETQAELGLRNLIDRNGLSTHDMFGNPIADTAPHLQQQALEKNYAAAQAAMPQNMGFVQQQLAGLSGGIGGMLASPLPSFGGIAGFAGQGAQEKIDQAKQLGIADPNKINDAMNQAALVGGGAGLAMEGLGGIAPLIAKPLEGTIGKMAAGAVSHAVPLGAIGATQQLADNYITQQNYDPSQNLLEGVPQSALTMAALGGLSHVGGEILNKGIDRLKSGPAAAQAARDAAALQAQQDEVAQLARQNQIREAAGAQTPSPIEPQPLGPETAQTRQPAPQPSPIPGPDVQTPGPESQPPPQQASAFDVSQQPPEIQQLLQGDGSGATPPPPSPPETLQPDGTRQTPQPISLPDGSQAPPPTPGQVVTIPSVNGIDDIAAAVKDPKTPKMDGPSLLEFISKNGGVNDTGGELSALDADKWHLGKPGKGKLIKDTGMSPDAMAQKLQDAGYIQTQDPTGQPTAQDLYDSVQKELAGNKIYVPTPENQVKTDLINKYQAAQDQLTQMGVDPSRMTHAEIAHALTDPSGYIDAASREEPPLVSGEDGAGRNNPSPESGTSPSATGRGPYESSNTGPGLGPDEIPFSATRPLKDIEAEIPSDVVQDLARPGQPLQMGDSIDAAPVMQKLRAELNRQGLGDIAVKLHDALWDETDPDRLVSGKIEQTPTGHIIHLATKIYDPNLSTDELTNRLKSVMSHETVHAMRDLGVFKPADWKTLVQESLKKKIPNDPQGRSFFDKAEYDYAPRNAQGQLIDSKSMAPDVASKWKDHIAEEAVAEMYRNFSDGNRRVNSVPTGLLNKMMHHMVKIVRAIGRSKADKLMESVRNGELSRRPLQPGQVLAPKDRFMMAYHGTKHLFKDFNVDKIGTGEGNTDYGHGLYFAQNKAVAEHYRKQEALPGTGRIYSVEIPDAKHMMDWDAPFEDHPKTIQKKILGAVDEMADNGSFDAEQLAQGLRSGDLGHMTGQELYKELTDLIKEHTGDYEHPDAQASAILRNNGVLGNKYLDQGSRGDFVPAKDKTRNYVVFHHDDIKIKGKEEQLGPRAPNWNENAEKAHAQSAMTLGSRDAANPDLDRTPIVLYTKDTTAGTPNGTSEGIHWFDKDKSSYGGFSMSTSTDMVNNWGNNLGPSGAIYPVHIFPKKIADFRDPQHLNEAVNYQIQRKYGDNYRQDFIENNSPEHPWDSGLNGEYNSQKRIRGLIDNAREFHAVETLKSEGKDTKGLEFIGVENKEQLKKDISALKSIPDAWEAYKRFAHSRSDYEKIHQKYREASDKHWAAMSDPTVSSDNLRIMEETEAALSREMGKIGDESHEKQLEFADEIKKHKSKFSGPVEDEVLKHLSQGYIPNGTYTDLNKKANAAFEHSFSTVLALSDGTDLTPDQINQHPDVIKANDAAAAANAKVVDPESYREEFNKIQQQYIDSKNKAKESIPDGPISNELAKKYFPDIYNRMAKGDYHFWEDPEMLNHMGAQATYMKEHYENSRDPLNVFVPAEHGAIIKSVFNKGPWDTSNPYINLMAKRVSATTESADSYTNAKGSWKPDLNSEIILRAAALPDMYVKGAGWLGEKLDSVPGIGSKANFRLSNLKYGVSRESFETGIQNWLSATADRNTPLARLYKTLFENGAKNLDVNNAYVAASIAPQKAQAQVLSFRRGAKKRLEEKLGSQLGMDKNIEALKKELDGGGVVSWLERTTNSKGGKISKGTLSARNEIIPQSYAYAKHALEYNEYGRSVMQKHLPDGAIDQKVSGMSDQEAKTIIKFVEEKMSPLERDKILQIHQEMMNIAEQTRQTRIDYGLEPDYKKSRANLVSEQSRLQSLFNSSTTPKEKAEYQRQIDRFQKAIDKIPDYKFYVPLKSGEGAEHVLYDSNGQPIGKSDFSGGAKFNVRGSEDISRTGRSTYAEQIIPNLLNMHENTINRGFRNEAGNKLLDTIKEAYARNDPDIGKVFGEPEVIPYEWKKAADGSVSLGPVAELTNPGEYFVTKVNGIDNKVHIKTDEMQKALNGFQKGDTGTMAATYHAVTFIANHPVIRPGLDAFSRLNHFVNAGASIPFAVRLFFKHTAMAKLNADAFSPALAKKVGQYSTQYLWGLLRNDPKVMAELEDLRSKGGIMQPFHAGTTSNFQSDLHALDAHAGQLQTMMDSNLPWHVKMAKLNHGLEKAEKFLTGFTNKVEWTTRLAVNKAFLEHGATPQEAAYMAQDLTGNFARGGHMTPALAKMYPFYNAGVQSDNATLSSLIRMGAKGGVKKVAAWTARLAALGFMAGIYNDFVGNQHKDPDGNNPYWLLNDNQRNGASIALMIPGTDKTVKFPNPFKLLSIPINAGNRMYAVTSGHMNPWDMASKTAQEFVGGVDHFESSPSANPILAMAPGVARPVMGAAMNTNWNGSQVHPTSIGYPELPHSTISKRSTPEWAKSVASGISTITGGDQYAKPGIVEMYPDDIDYYAKALGGSFGDIANRILMMSSAAVVPDQRAAQGKEPFSWTDFPVVNSLVGNVNKQQVENAFYTVGDRYARIGKEQALIKHNMNQGDYQKAQVDAARLSAADPEAWAMAPIYEQTDKYIGTLKHQIRSYQSDPDMSVAQKAAMVQDAEDKIYLTQRQFISAAVNGRSNHEPPSGQK